MPFAAAIVSSWMKPFGSTSRLRLIALGASIGGVAAAVVLIPAAAVLHAWSTVLPAGDTPPPLDPTEWAASLAIAIVAAGVVAGGVAAFVPAAARVLGSRHSARAWLVCLGGGVTWALVATALEHHLRPSPARLAASLIPGIALGAILNVALFPRVVAAISAARPAFHRQVWAGAKRLAAFSAGLLGMLFVGPLTLGAGLAIAGLLRHGWPPDPLAARYMGPLFVAWITTIIVAVVGFRAAGVSRTGRDRATAQPR